MKTNNHKHFSWPFRNSTLFGTKWQTLSWNSFGSTILQQLPQRSKNQYFGVCDLQIWPGVKPLDGVIWRTDLQRHTCQWNVTFSLHSSFISQRRINCTDPPLPSSKKIYTIFFYLQEIHVLFEENIWVL